MEPQQEGDRAAEAEHARRPGYWPDDLDMCWFVGGVSAVDSSRRHHMNELDPAIDILRQHAETCEHNAPIHEASGDTDQAKLDRELAKSYRAAEQHLRAVQG